MIKGQIQPLVIAARVLKPEILNLVRKAPFNHYGWAIADRWALNSPEALQALQAKGEVVLFNRLLEQQSLEQEIILRGMDQINQGMTIADVMSLNEMATEL